VHYCPSCGKPLVAPGNSSVAYGASDGALTGVQDVSTAKKGFDIRIVIIAVVLIALAVTAGVLAYPRQAAPTPSGNGSSNNNGSNGNGSSNGGGTNPSGGNPGGTGTVQSAMFTVYKSPPYMPYTVLVPQGWTGRGGQFQNYKGFQLPGINFAAWDASQTQTIFFAEPDYPSFIDPASTDYNGVTVGSQYATGTWWITRSLNILVYPTLTASGYIQGFLVHPCKYAVSVLCSLLAGSQQDPAFTLAVDKSENRPYLLTLHRNWFELTCGDSQNAVTSAADATLSYTSNSGPYQVGVLVEICQASVLGTHYWYASVSGYGAPRVDSNKVVGVYKKAMPTVVMNYAWVKSVVANAQAQGQIISGYIQQWQQADIQMFQITLGSPNSATGWIDALGGVQTASYGSFTCKIPVDYNHAWITGADSSSPTVYASNTSTPPSAGSNWNSMSISG